MRAFGYRSGFTAVETIMGLTILGFATSLIVPMYRSYMMKSDLELARQAVTQGIDRARFLSQIADQDSQWGFSLLAVPGKGVVYKGSSYAVRDPAFDELYPIRPSVQTSGLTDVTFEKITGRPDQQGVITLSVANAESAVNIRVADDDPLSIPEEWITICVNPQGIAETLHVPESLWQYHESNGALWGNCASLEAPAVSPNADQGIGPDFNVTADTVTPEDDFFCRLRILGTALRAAGEPIPITLRLVVGGETYEPFGDWDSPSQSQISSDTDLVFDCPDEYAGADDIDISVRSWRKKSNWYSGESDSHWEPIVTAETALQDSPFVEVLKKEDVIPPIPALQNASTRENFVTPYLDLDTDTIRVGQNQILYLIELGSNSPSQNGDFQDLVLLLTLTEPL